MQMFSTPNLRESIGFALGGPMETFSTRTRVVMSLARALYHFDSARNPAFLVPVPIGSQGENRCSMG